MEENVAGKWNQIVCSTPLNTQRCMYITYMLLVDSNQDV